MVKIKKSIVIIFLLIFNSAYCFSFFGLFKKDNETKEITKVEVGKKNQVTEQQQVLELVNKERVKKGLVPLKLNKKLNDIALKKSNDMAINNYFSHNSKKLGTPFEQMKKSGIKYKTAGENIAKGQKTPQEVMTTWMNSKGHRDNIMNPKFTEMGISRDTQNKYVWTQNFIGK